MDSSELFLRVSQLAAPGRVPWIGEPGDAPDLGPRDKMLAKMDEVMCISGDPAGDDWFFEPFYVLLGLDEKDNLDEEDVIEADTPEDAMVLFSMLWVYGIGLSSVNNEEKLRAIARIADVAINGY